MELVRIEDPEVWYAPDIRDNLKKPEHERFAVLLKPLTRREMFEAKGPVITKLREESKDGVEMLANGVESVRDAVLRAGVLGVRNLHVRKVKGGAESFDEITDVDGFIETGWELALNTVYAALEDHSIMAEGMLGKSVSPSDSSAPPTPGSGNGDVVDVGGGMKAKPTRGSYDMPGDATQTIQASTSTSRPSSPVAHGVS